MDSHDIILYDPRTLEGMAELGNKILDFFKELFNCNNYGNYELE